MDFDVKIEELSEILASRRMILLTFWLISWKFSFKNTALECLTLKAFGCVKQKIIKGHIIRLEIIKKLQIFWASLTKALDESFRAS